MAPGDYAAFIGADASWTWLQAHRGATCTSTSDVLVRALENGIRYWSEVRTEDQRPSVRTKPGVQTVESFKRP